MRVNRIALENFRCHDTYEIDFTPGINLLLGPNGSGKSSVLEAVGVALFDADVRSSYSDAVRHGKTFARMTVEIEGNDGNEYVVERRIGASPWVRLYRKGEKSSRLEGKGAVGAKMRVLAGIETNEKNIYQNVVAAYQNKIIDIFSETPSVRERIFDSIFDTAIYRTIYESYAKEARDRYVSDLKISQADAQRLQPLLRDSKALRKIVRKLKKEKKEEEVKRERCTKQLRKLEKERETLEKNRIERDNAAQKQEHIERLLTYKRSERARMEKSREEAQRAVTAVAKHKNEYTKYRQTEQRLHTLEQQIEHLELKEKEKQAIHERIESIRRESAEKTAEYKTTQKQIAELSNRASVLEKEIETIRTRADTACRTAEESERAAKEMKAFFTAFEQEYRRSVELDKEIERCRAQHEQLQAALEPEEKITEKIAAAQKECARLDREKTQRDACERLRHELRVKLDENSEAETTLSGGICPFLKQECINIAQGSSGEDYFADRRRKLNTELKSCEEECARYRTLDSDIAAANKDLSRHESRKSEQKNISSEMHRLDAERALSEREVENAWLKIEKLARSYRIEIDTMTDNDDLHTLHTVYSARVAQSGEQATAASIAAQREQELLDTRCEALDSERVQLESLRAAQERNSEVRSALEKEKRDRESDREEIERETNTLGQLKTETRKLKGVLATVQEGYDTYMRNCAKAEELPAASAAVETRGAEIVELEKQKEEQQRVYENLADLYDEETYRAIRRSMEQTAEQKDSAMEKVASRDKELAIACREEEENRRREEEYRAATVKISRIEEKISIADRFRVNIGAMGKQVARRLLQRIELAATENFRSITGRGERIHWQESYTIFLSKGDLTDAPKFEMLSGGEQVAVALSIRAAMASLLTRCRFAIFDEPTINLDAQRRVALAESLSYILKDLDQAIIVTHDDIFTEMAQNIVPF
jgi:exonuclease SbcC